MRITTQILLFFIFMNAGATLIQDLGADEALGTDPQVNAPNDLKEAQNEANTTETQGGGLSTLYGLTIVLGQLWGAFTGALMPATGMLLDVGVPKPIVTFLRSGMAIVGAIEIGDFLRGVR